jgi:RimJ/RimL family protein N-acetyltransferase
MRYDVSAMLEAPRLWLRRLRPSDEPDLIALDSDVEVMRYVGSPPGIRAPAETVERVRQRIYADYGPYGWWVVEGKHDRAFHGLGLLVPMPEGDDLEVGYRLARRSWGRGIATEAASALVEYALGVSRCRERAVATPKSRLAPRPQLGFSANGPFEYKGARRALRAQAGARQPGR